jgi:hypothetical protein
MRGHMSCAIESFTKQVVAKPFLLRSLLRLVAGGAAPETARPFTVLAITHRHQDARRDGWESVSRMLKQDLDVSEVVASLPAAMKDKEMPVREQAMLAFRRMLERGIAVPGAADGFAKAKGPPKDDSQELACQAAVTLRARLANPPTNVLRQLARELVGMLSNDDEWQLFRHDACEALLRLASAGAAERAWAWRRSKPCVPRAGRRFQRHAFRPQGWSKKSSTFRFTSSACARLRSCPAWAMSSALMRGATR